MLEFVSFTTEEEMSQKAALAAVACMEEAFARQGYAGIILSGGNTPHRCYQLIAALLNERRIPLNSLYWFFADERWVDKNDEQSNERMAREILLKPLSVPPGQIFSWQPLSGTPYICAEKYGRLVHDFFTAKRRVPDLTLLGLGADGHTASIIPGAKIIDGKGGKRDLTSRCGGPAIALYLPEQNTYRLSLTPAILNKSRHIMFLASGQAKREAFARVRAQDTSLPATWIRNENLKFFITADILDPAGKTRP